MVGNAEFVKLKQALGKHSTGWEERYETPFISWRQLGYFEAT